MLDIYSIRIFYADGGVPESGQRRIGQLSPKWLGIFDDLLANHGPVIRHNMGSTLSHFDIVMGGPMVELLAYDETCFRMAISLGTDSEQDRATVLQFRDIWTRFVESAGNTVTPTVLQFLDQAATEQCILILDMSPSIDDDQKLALLQLGDHLAGAYFKYCAGTDPASGIIVN